MVFRRHGCVAKSSTKVTTLLPVSRLALTPKSSFSLARLFFNGLLSRHLYRTRRPTSTSGGKGGRSGTTMISILRSRGANALTGAGQLYRVPVPTMAIQTTYTQARAELARLCDAAAKDNETVIITRRGAEDVALVSAAELRSLRETAHLLRSPRNAERLLSALARARRRGERPQSLRSLWREVGLEEAEG
jgi:antitoxin YefM